MQHQQPEHNLELSNYSWTGDHNISQKKSYAYQLSLIWPSIG